MSVPRPLVPETVEPLRGLVDAGVLDAGEIAVVDALVRLCPDAVEPGVMQAIALTALGRRLGHSCVDLERAGALFGGAATMPDRVGEIELPAIDDWVEMLTRSELVQVGEVDRAPAERPLVFAPERARLWMSRYAYYEATLCELLEARAGQGAAFADEASISSAIRTVFGPDASETDDPQCAAVATALKRRLSFITGGPGTGKTWTVGRLLEALGTLDRPDGAPWAAALAAPTGKAAERMTQAVAGDLTATTLHVLLGLYPGMAATVEAPRRLPHDLVVVDEASMIDLAMMTRLLGAVRDDAHVVFVGDPDQLLSVEVGSVLRDVVDAADHDSGGALAGSVAKLARVHRFAGDIGALARAVGEGAADEVLRILGDDAHPDVSLVDPHDSTAVGALHRELIDTTGAMVTAAREGDRAGALQRAQECKVLAATRIGPWGLRWWNRRLAEAFGFSPGQWAPGRPVIVTRNDRANGVFNGDTGIVVPGSDEESGVQVALSGAGGMRLVAPSRLRDQDDWWAMTVHKSQGSEFDHVIVSLPRGGSPILSRELLYTAVTRARTRVTVLGTPEVVRAATERRVDRASGVRERLVGR